MGFKVDLTDVELRSFEPLPPGRFAVECVDLIYAPTSKRSGKPKVTFVNKVLMGLDTWVVDVDPKKHGNVFYEVSLQDQSLWNVKRTLVAYGDSPEDLEGELEIEKADYIGRRCAALMAVGEFEGTPQQRTRRLEPLKPEDLVKLKALAPKVAAKAPVKAK